MTYRFSHVGVPTVERHENELVDTVLGISRQDAAFSEPGFEYIRFLDNCALPERVGESAHIAYFVENMIEALEDMDSVIFGPWSNGSEYIAFAIKDSVLLELIGKTCT